MKRNRRLRIIALLLLAVSFFPLLSTAAALPTLTPEERDERATLIVTGRVVGSRIMTLRKPTSTVTFVRLAAEIESIEKGADAVPAGQLLDIRCRRIDRRTSPGPQGHDNIPAEGSRFTMWLRENPDAVDQVQWEPLEPNGIELLDNSPAMAFAETVSPASLREYLLGGIIGIATFIALAVFLWRRRAIR